MGRHRIVSIAWVGAGLWLLDALAPDAPARREVFGLVAVPFGYGHLLGALLFARSSGPFDLFATALRASTLAMLLGLYLAALDGPAGPIVLAALLLLSGWHIAENDLALSRAYGRGLRVPRIERGSRAHAVPLAAIGLLAAATFASPSGARALHTWGLPALPVTGPSFESLASAVLMYHAIRWLLFFRDRAQCLAPPAARRLRSVLLGIHALPLGVSVLSWLWLPGVHEWLASPAVYLFWSAAHAVQTAARRGLEPRK
jgi:hypothetical protein